ncbi:MAG: peptide chain release factor 1 [Thermodesulfobacteriota bacterium]
MLKKLEEVEIKYIEIEQNLNAEGLDPENIRKLSMERAELEEIIDTYREYKNVAQNIENNKLLLNDDKELAQLAREENSELEEQKSRLEKHLELLLIPKDPNDKKNVILEIRAGAGGEEAALFASNLLRMYERFCEHNNWKLETLNLNETGIGGIKEISASIEGRDVFGKLKYESGVHRVQRIPATETGGRIHTSTATVAILAEADEVDINIEDKDLRIDTYRASGAGGQHINKTDSAIRITHAPTGIVVQCQDERSQHKNKASAMKMLRAKLFEMEELKKMNELSDNRKSQVGSGDRSEKIRTYNYPQGRVTDHRIGVTLHKLDTILDGDLSELTQLLTTYFQAESLKEISN